MKYYELLHKLCTQITENNVNDKTAEIKFFLNSSTLLRVLDITWHKDQQEMGIHLEKVGYVPITAKDALTLIDSMKGEPDATVDEDEDITTFTLADVQLREPINKKETNQNDAES